jgi:hypothetical protein
VKLGLGQCLDGFVQEGENVLISELANLRAELVTVNLVGLPCHCHWLLVAVTMPEFPLKSNVGCD